MQKYFLLASLAFGEDFNVINEISLPVNHITEPSIDDVYIANLFDEIVDTTTIAPTLDVIYEVDETADESTTTTSKPITSSTTTTAEPTTTSTVEPSTSTTADPSRTTTTNSPQYKIVKMFRASYYIPSCNSWICW